MPLIRLNDHSLHFMRSVGKLYEQMELTDCVIVTKDGSVNAHKLVLAIHSAYFKKLLKDDGITSLAFKEVEHHIMKLIMDIMYYGEANVPEADVGLFTETANLFQILSLNFALQNLSETIPMKITIEGNSATTCGLDTLKEEEKNFIFQERGVTCKTNLIYETGGKSNAGFENVGFQMMHSPAIEERNLLEEFSEQLNDYNSIKSIRSNIKVDVDLRDEQNLEGELDPFTFVEVPSMPLKNESNKEQSTSCMSDLQLKNPLEELQTDCVACIKEEEFSPELQIKTEKKELIDHYEELKDISGSRNALLTLEMKQSSHDFSVNVADDTLTDSKPFESVDEISVLNDECIVEKTENLEVKFESICVVSEFNLKEEKLFDADTDIATTDDIDPSPWKQSCESVKKGGEELSSISSLRHMNQGFQSACANKFQFKEAYVALNRIDSFCLNDKGSNNSENPGEFRSEKRFACPRSDKIFDHLDDPVLCHLAKPQEGNVGGTNGKRSIRYGVSKNQFFDPTCGELFGGKKEHIPNHLVQKSFSCQFCCSTFTCVNLLQIHMREFHLDKKTFVCGICKACFPLKIQLKNHVRKHASKNSSFDFGHVSSLKSDLIRQVPAHTNEKLFQCKVCPESLSLENNLTTYSSEKSPSCNCIQGFFCKKSNLQDKRTLTEEKPFSCEICQDFFAHKNSLQIHIRTHTGEKPFSCEVCQASFSKKSNLRNHIRTHTGERPFSSEVCQRSFDRKDALQSHQRIHSGEIPISCEVCQASFPKKFNLRIHMRTHTGEKPFSCEVCKRTFSLKSNLRMHAYPHWGETILVRSLSSIFL